MPAGAGMMGMSLKHNGEDVQLEVIYGDSTAFNMLGFNIVKYNRNVTQGVGSLWLTEVA